MKRLRIELRALKNAGKIRLDVEGYLLLAAGHLANGSQYIIEKMILNPAPDKMVRNTDLEIIVG